MTNRKSISLLAIALSLCAALVFFSPFSQNEEQQLPPAPVSEDTQIETPPILSRTPVAPPQLGPLKVVDGLTGQQLDMPLKLTNAEGETILTSGDLVDLSTYSADLEISYTLEHGEDPFICQFENRSDWINKEWVLTIPFYAIADFRVQGLPEDFHSHNSLIQIYPDPRTLAGLLPDAPTDDSASKFRPRNSVLKSFGGKFELDYKDMTLKGMVRSALRAKRLPTLASVEYSSANDSSSIPIAASGKYIAGWLDQSGNSSYVEIELRPGLRTEAVLQFIHRPLIQGILVDWNNVPVGNEQVSLTTALDLKDYDLTAADRHATIMYVRKGVPYHSAHIKTLTDMDGRFAMRMPSGTDYAIESHAKGGYVFWNTRENGPLQIDNEIVLRLEEPTEESQLTVTFSDSEGAPITKGQVNLSVPGDLPFFRQWPDRAPLNDKGEVKAMGFEPGTDIAVILFQDGLKGGVYVPQYTVVPTSNRLDIFVPLDAYLEKVE